MGLAHRLGEPAFGRNLTPCAIDQKIIYLPASPELGYQPPRLFASTRPRFCRVARVLIFGKHRWVLSTDRAAFANLQSRRPDRCLARNQAAVELCKTLLQSALFGGNFFCQHCADFFMDRPQLINRQQIEFTLLHYPCPEVIARHFSNNADAELFQLPRPFITTHATIASKFRSLSRTHVGELEYIKQLMVVMWSASSFPLCTSGFVELASIAVDFLLSQTWTTALSARTPLTNTCVVRACPVVRSGPGGSLSVCQQAAHKAGLRTKYEKLTMIFVNLYKRQIMFTDRLLNP